MTEIILILNIVVMLTLVYIVAAHWHTPVKTSAQGVLPNWLSRENMSTWKRTVQGAISGAAIAMANNIQEVLKGATTGIDVKSVLVSAFGVASLMFISEILHTKAKDYSQEPEKGGDQLAGGDGT